MSWKNLHTGSRYSGLASDLGLDAAVGMVTSRFGEDAGTCFSRSEYSFSGNVAN